MPCEGRSVAVGRAGIHRQGLISTWYLKNMFKTSDDPCVYVGIVCSHTKALSTPGTEGVGQKCLFLFPLTSLFKLQEKQAS